jgi:hypothetical protein
MLFYLFNFVCPDQMPYFLRSPLANTIHFCEIKDVVEQLVTACRTKSEAYMTTAGTESLSFVPSFILGINITHNLHQY